jgi:hypothetical protein
MKYLTLTIIGLCLMLYSNAQTATNVLVLDTRGENLAPSAYRSEAKFEFKARDIVGVPGVGGYSGMLTFAPWGDYTGNKVHQLNLNDGGLYWRTGSQGSTWESWQKLVLENDNGITLSDSKVFNGANFYTNGYSVMTFSCGAWSSVQGTNGKAFSFQTHNNVGTGGFEAMAIYYGEGGKILMAHNGGNVGIGTTDPGSYKLNVWGKIRAHEIVVNTTGADFVFDSTYNLRSLPELETFIKQNKHLPEIVPAKEMQENGVSAGEMQAKLLQKQEETALYLIELSKQIEDLKKQNIQLHEANELLKAQFTKLQSQIAKSKAL